MRANRLFITSAILLIIGIVSIGSHWNGNAGLNLGWPASQNAVKFSGEAVGLSALIGVITLVPGIVLLLVALIVAVVQETRLSSNRRRSIP